MRNLKFVLLAAAISVLAGGLIEINSAAAYAGPTTTCPTGTNCSCSNVFAPVICGKQKCRYNNFCIAQCAGWTAKQCTDVP